MYIKPSASIRNNYNEIAELCRETGEPIYLTKNGEGDLVVMDIAAFTKRESMLRLRENLVAVEEERLRGEQGYSIDEVVSMVEQAIKEVFNGQRK
jgi:prevent-host-death family protein